MDNEDDRKTPMNTFSCKVCNQKWVRAYAGSTGQKPSEVIDKALDEYRKNHDVEVDMELAEEKLTNALLQLYDIREKMNDSIGTEEAQARKRITAYLLEVRTSTSYKRNLLTQDAFDAKLREWLMENVCKGSGIRIEKATKIARGIWVLIEAEAKKHEAG